MFPAVGGTAGDDDELELQASMARKHTKKSERIQGR